MGEILGKAIDPNSTIPNDNPEGNSNDGFNRNFNDNSRGNSNDNSDKDPNDNSDENSRENSINSHSDDSDGNSVDSNNYESGDKRPEDGGVIGDQYPEFKTVR